MAENKIDKKLIQKTRTVRYFIDAVKEIIEKEGIEKVNIRLVADIAGYNSATLYNYFENLDHLLLYTCLDYLEEYLQDIPNYVKYAKNSEEVYLRVWSCFVDHSFEKADIYYTMFFAKLQHEKASYISEYYAMFPLDVKRYNPEIRNMLLSTNIRERSMQLMKNCIEEKIVSYERANIIDELIICVYESLLMNVKNKSINPAVAKTMAENYFKEIFKKMK